jgi:hypothetical protein
MKLTKNQKLLALSAIVVAVALLMLGCETGVKTEVKTDSTINDSTLVDTLKVDTIGKD